jgi:hypothetical protein
MTNDVSLFSAAMQQRPAHLANVTVDEQTKRLAGGDGGLRISIKGGVWRMLNGGEELERNEDRALNVVIVRSSPDTARTMYADAYVEGEQQPPICWSSNGVAPEPDVKTPQSISCATCENNVAGSGPNGSRACRFSRNLAVTLENDPTGKIFKLSLPAQSIFGKIENNVAPLQAYAKQLAAHDTPAAAVVTEMRFDTTSATPKIGFKAVRWLSPQEYEIAKKQGDTAEAIAATKTTVFQQDNGGVAASTAAPAAAEEPDTSEPATVVEKPATVAAKQPVTRQRKVKEDGAVKAQAAAPAPAQVFPAAVNGTSAMSLEEMQKQMAALMAAMAAQAPGALPEVVQKKATSAAPAPVGAAAMLSGWDSQPDA